MRSLSTLHVLNEVLGASAGYTKGCEGGISRLAQYTRYLLAELEQLRILRLYAGSPHGLRFFVALMTHVSPIFLAPYFRNFCSATDRVTRERIAAVAASAHDYGSQGSSSAKHVVSSWEAFDPCAAGFFAAALYCAVICTLYAVLCGIEDLCDGDGLDDLHFNLDVELDEASAIGPLPAAPCREPGGVATVLFAFGDCLGPERTAGGAAFEEDRVFAHRDPTKRLSPLAAVGGRQQQAARRRHGAILRRASRWAVSACLRVIYNLWNAPLAPNEARLDDRFVHAPSYHSAGAWSSS
jgi:hypothetical protein